MLFPGAMLHDEVSAPTNDVLDAVQTDRAADPLGSFDPSVPFREAKRLAMEQWERWYVLTLLQYTSGNLSRASRVAQTDRTYLRKLVRRYTSDGVKRPAP